MIGLQDVGRHIFRAGAVWGGTNPLGHEGNPSSVQPRTIRVRSIRTYKLYQMYELYVLNTLRYIRFAHMQHSNVDVQSGTLRYKAGQWAVSPKRRLVTRNDLTYR